MHFVIRVWLHWCKVSPSMASTTLPPQLCNCVGVSVEQTTIPQMDSLVSGDQHRIEFYGIILYGL